MVDILEKVPDELIAGDTCKFYFDAGEDVPGDWALTIALAGKTTDLRNVTASVSGSLHLFTITAAQSKVLEPGDYQYQIRKAKAGEVYTAKRGVIKVIASVEHDGAGRDHRPLPEKMLEKVELALAGNDDPDIQEYTIAGRTIKRYSPRELLDLRSRLIAEIAREKRKAEGKGPKRVAVQFNG